MSGKIYQTRLYRALGSLLVVLVIAGCATHTPSPATTSVAPSDPPKSMLWVGNSFFYYNNSMHGHVAQLARGERRRSRSAPPR